MIAAGALGASTINTMTVAQAHFIIDDVKCRTTAYFKNKVTMSFLSFHHAPHGQKIIVPRDNRHIALVGGD